jgi:hypothetical protein
MLLSKKGYDCETLDSLKGLNKNTRGLHLWAW